MKIARIGTCSIMAKIINHYGKLCLEIQKSSLYSCIDFVICMLEYDFCMQIVMEMLSYCDLACYFLFFIAIPLYDLS